MSVWNIISAISPILAPIISLILVVLGRIIWNQEKRIRGLEKTAVRHGRTLYGDDQDLQQTGLSQDIDTLMERVDDIDEKMSEVVRYHEQMAENQSNNSDE